jgi:hypothetical protein
MYTVYIYIIIETVYICICMCKSERHPGDEVPGSRISSGLDTRLCARIPSVSAPMVVLPCTLFDRDCRIGSQRTGVGQVLETTTARDFAAISDAWTFWGQLLSRVLLVARLLRLHMFSSLNVKKIAGNIITVESKVIYICTAWSCMAPSPQGVFPKLDGLSSMATICLCTLPEKHR